MTGNFSSPTRQLSSQSQTFKREARRAQRAGFGRAAEQLYMTGTQAGIQEKATRNSGIRSAEEEVSTEAQQQRDIAAANAQRAGLIRQASLQNTGTTDTTKPKVETTGTTDTTKPKVETTGTTKPEVETTAPKIDYLKPYHPGVEQTQEEGDAIRRKALQDAYDKLTNPEGEAGSIKEILKKKAAAVPTPAQKAGPTFGELLGPLNAYFDKRDAEKKAAGVSGANDGQPQVGESGKPMQVGGANKLPQASMGTNTAAAEKDSTVLPTSQEKPSFASLFPVNPARVAASGLTATGATVRGAENLINTANDLRKTVGAMDATFAHAAQRAADTAGRSKVLQTAVDRNRELLFGAQRQAAQAQQEALAAKTMLGKPAAPGVAAPGARAAFESELGALKAEEKASRFAGKLGRTAEAMKTAAEKATNAAAARGGVAKDFNAAASRLNSLLPAARRGAAFLRTVNPALKVAGKAMAGIAPTLDVANSGIDAYKTLVKGASAEDLPDVATRSNDLLDSWDRNKGVGGQLASSIYNLTPAVFMGGGKTTTEGAALVNAAGQARNQALTAEGEARLEQMKNRLITSKGNDITKLRREIISDKDFAALPTDEKDKVSAQVRARRDALKSARK